MLTREAILSADDLKTEKVAVPEWGGHVFVKTMTGTEKDNFESGLVNADGKVSVRDIRARMVAAVTVDEVGNALFTDSDINAISGKSAAALDRIFAASKKLNAVTDEDVEELGKHSGQAQAGDSISD